MREPGSVEAEAGSLAVPCNSLRSMWPTSLGPVIQGASSGLKSSIMESVSEIAERRWSSKGRKSEWPMRVGSFLDLSWFLSVKGKEAVKKRLDKVSIGFCAEFDDVDGAVKVRSKGAGSKPTGLRPGRDNKSPVLPKSVRS